VKRVGFKPRVMDGENGESTEKMMRHVPDELSEK